MFYTIYKITNKLDGKIYIGKHQTKDLNDAYMGSGKHLRHSIAKYGIENFEKEILFQFDNEADMNAKESELVTEEFCLREDTYNICPGGEGGWGYLNSKDGLELESRSSSIKNWNKNARKIHSEKLKTDIKYRENFIQNSIIPASNAAKKLYEEGNGYWSGRKHSTETKQKLSEKKIGHTLQSGKKNSQFGTMWITNGIENKKVKKDIDKIPEGWYKGYKPRKRLIEI